MNERLDMLKRFNYWENEAINSGYLRSGYLETFSHFLGNRLVKVILGQRRSGKSYLLRMLI